jgi:hypothetical protein
MLPKNRVVLYIHIVLLINRLNQTGHPLGAQIHLPWHIGCSSGAMSRKKLGKYAITDYIRTNHTTPRVGGRRS